MRNCWSCSAATRRAGRRHWWNSTAIFCGGGCSRRLQDPEDAWECVYEALADFCLQWKRFSLERGSVKSYLAAIADRRALDLYRKNQR